MHFRSIPLFLSIVVVTACGGARAEYATGGAAPPAMSPVAASEADGVADESSPIAAMPMAPPAPPPPAAPDSLASGSFGRENRAAAFDKKGGDDRDRDAQSPGPGPAKKPAPSPSGKKQEESGKAGQASGGEGNGQGAGTGTSERRAPILIYTADFTMSVYEVQKSLDSVEALAKKNGGYLSKRDDHAITIRVPAGEFQGVINELSKLGDVTNRNVVSEDVTAEYRDLEVQLANNVALRDRFAKLLEKAQKVEEALQIERELGRITGEIERIKGRLKLLSELSSYSTITVHFAARSDQQINQGPFVLPLPWLSNLGLPRLLRL